MTDCERKCDVNDPSNYKPSSSHFLDCPVWVAILNYESDPV